LEITFPLLSAYSPEEPKYKKYNFQNSLILK